MTPEHRNALLTACAYATVFIQAADIELCGGSSRMREEAQAELAAALRNINPPAPDVPLVDWRVIGEVIDAE